MLIVGKGKKPDNEEVFYDGILYIISRKEQEYSIDVKCLAQEYDDPISLADIAKQYPDVNKVIYEGALRGYVYNYGNHRNDPNAEMWKRTGTTRGYA